MPKTAIVPRPRLSAKEATRPVLLGVPCYPPRHASGITTSRWDVVAVIVSTMRAAAMWRNHNVCPVEDEEGVVAVWEIAVDERDRHSQREENMTPEDNPPSVKRICRVSLVASIMLLLHGAEMLRCDEPHVVQGGSENLSEALSRTAWCYHLPAVEYHYL